MRLVDAQERGASGELHRSFGGQKAPASG